MHQLSRNTQARDYYRRINKPETARVASAFRFAVRLCTGSIPWWAIPKPVKKPSATGGRK